MSSTHNVLSNNEVLIVRHAEAFKTLKAVHGGAGTSLTEQGQRDTIALGGFIKETFEGHISNGVIYSSLVPQVLQTGQLLAKLLGISLVTTNLIRNINMGILDGLSDEKAQELYPAEMARLAKWRAGELPVEQIQIPGAESILEFKERVKSVISRAFETGASPLIFIVTRSVGIAILNLLLEQSELRGKGYTRFRMDPCSATLVIGTEIGHYTLEFVNRSDFLGRIMNYPDD
jgi:broad specificity phosphatase PhoE